MVETSSKQQVERNFAETFAAVQWFDANVDARFATANTATAVDTMVCGLAMRATVYCMMCPYYCMWVTDYF